MGKTSTTTQSVSIPPEVMARYNAVNASAEKVAATPFQKYSDDPNAFVAPLNSAQLAGIQQTGGFAQYAQPAYQAAQQQLGAAQQIGQAGTQAAYQPLMQGYAQGQQYGEAAGAQYGQAAQSAYPYMTRAESGIYGGLMAGQDASRQAMQYGLGAAGAASPYYQAATQGTQAGLAAASPYNQMATMAALQGAQGVSPEQFSGAAVERYMSPYLSNVVGQTMKAQAQQNAQQRQALSADAIRAGAFGGDRAGIAQANLAYQQNLANQQTIANLLQGGYGQALGAFQQQQGVNLAAEQANRAARQQLAQQALAIGQQGYGQQLGAAQQMAGLGQALYGQQMGTGQFIQGLGAQNFQQQLAGAQAQQGLGQMMSGLGFQTGQAYQGLGAQQAQLGMQNAAQQAALAQQQYGMGANTAQAQAALGAGAQAAGLQGAQAQIQAGTLAQQTEQAGKQALYNQFLQQQSYPFQVQQFLANIAMGTGALSGSTTTTTQPTGWSDRRLKENVRKVSETDDGLPIYKFRYKGEHKDETHIGYMADDVEKKHPDAVGEKDGYKYVDYDKVNSRESMGGAVHDGGLGRAGYTGGGLVSETELARLQQALTQPFTGYLPQGSQQGGLGGGMPRGGSSYVPQSQAHGLKLVTAGSPPSQQRSKLQEGLGQAAQAKQAANMIIGTYDPKTKSYQGGVFDEAKNLFERGKGMVGGGSDMSKPANPEIADKLTDAEKAELSRSLVATGGVIPRHGYSGDGTVPYRKSGDEGEYFPQDILDDDKKRQLKTAEGGGGSGGKSGPSPLSLGMKAAGSLASLIPGFGPFIGAGLNFGSNFVARGGVIPRQHFEDGGASSANAGDEELIRQFLPLVKNVESGNRNIKNPVSSASGVYQFMPDTFVSTAQKYGLPYTREDYSNTEAQEAVAPLHARDLIAAYRAKGIEPSVQALRLGWAGGIAGGPQIYKDLQERPNDPATSATFATPKVIAQNPTWFYHKDQTPKTIAELNDTLMAGMGGGGLGRGRQVAAAQTSPEQGGIGQAASKLGDLWSAASKYAAPIGAGIFAAASSPSPKARVAIMQGIGAGLAAMQPAESKEAAIAQQKEATRTQQTITARNAMLLAQTAFFGEGENRMIFTKAGPMSLKVWQSMRPEEQPEPLAYNEAMAAVSRLPEEERKKIGFYGSLTPGEPKPAGAPGAPGAPAPGGTTPEGGPAKIAPMPFSTIGDASRAQAKKDFQEMMVSPDAMAAQKTQSNQLEGNLTQNALVAANYGNSLNQLSSILLTLPKEGFAAPGVTFDVRAKAANLFNDLLGVTHNPQLRLNANELGSAAAAQKIAAIQSFMREQQAGQTSLGALKLAQLTVPTTDMPIEGIREVLADNYINKQRELDQLRHLNEYKKLATNAAMPDKYLAQNAINAFRSDFADTRYGEEKAHLKKLFSSYTKDGKPWFSTVYGQGARPAYFIDHAMKAPGLSRYIENN